MLNAPFCACSFRSFKLALPALFWILIFLPLIELDCLPSPTSMPLPARSLTSPADDVILVLLAFRWPLLTEPTFTSDLATRVLVPLRSTLPSAKTEILPSLVVAFRPSATMLPACVLASMF